MGCFQFELPIGQVLEHQIRYPSYDRSFNGRELAQDLQCARMVADNLLDLLPPEQLTAGLLETMANPIEGAVAISPLADEPVMEDEASEESRHWFKKTKAPRWIQP